MLESFVVKEYARIDDDARREKDVVDYIAGMVRSDRESLMLAFDPGHKIVGDEIDGFLYHKIRSSMDKLQTCALMRVGYREDSRYSPFLSVGWVYVDGDGAGRSFKVSEEGRKVYNDLARIKGRKTLDEQASSIIEGFSKASEDYTLSRA